MKRWLSQLSVACGPTMLLAMIFLAPCILFLLGVGRHGLLNTLTDFGIAFGLSASIGIPFGMAGLIFDPNRFEKKDKDGS